MRAFETFIRVSTERLSSRRQQGWLTPGRSRKVVLSALAVGFALVIIWTCALGYMLYQLIAFVFV